jgi:hypothetical protein
LHVNGILAAKDGELIFAEPFLQDAQLRTELQNAAAAQHLFGDLDPELS